MNQEQTPGEKTTFLEERIKQNESYQSLDLNKWSFDKIKEDTASLNILEFCCGTGKQTEYLAKTFVNSQITAVDISPEAIDTIRESHFFKKDRMTAVLSGIDEFFHENKNKYDLIFVSYGLYYAKNISEVIDNIIDSLNTGGDFIVQGPYGKNNKNLFDLVIASGVQIPQPVLYSCTDFMNDTVIKQCLSHFNPITVHTAINSVKWDSAQDVISYWKNTTFYDEKFEAAFISNINTHFEMNSNFIIEKHIMLFQGLNKT